MDGLVSKRIEAFFSFIHAIRSVKVEIRLYFLKYFIYIIFEIYDDPKTEDIGNVFKIAIGSFPYYFVFKASPSLYSMSYQRVAWNNSFVIQNLFEPVSD